MECDNFKPQPTFEALELGRHLIKLGWKIDYEKWDGYKHIDIAVLKAKVDIEIDGKQHSYDPEQALSDLKRTYYSLKKGYYTLRIPNVLVRDDIEIKKTAEFIDMLLRSNMKHVNAYYAISRNTVKTKI